MISKAILLVFFLTPPLTTSSTLVPTWLWPWTCPIPMCMDPCHLCGPTSYKLPSSCVTKPGYFYHNGRKCPGCPLLVSCDGITNTCCSLEDKPSKYLCEGLFGCPCCGGEWFVGSDASTTFGDAAGFCKDTGRVVAPICPPHKEGPLCGDAICKAGLECCNPSCGTCAPPGVLCTQQACDDPWV